MCVCERLTWSCGVLTCTRVPVPLHPANANDADALATELAEAKAAASSLGEQVEEMRSELSSKSAALSAAEEEVEASKRELQESTSQVTNELAAVQV